MRVRALLLLLLGTVLLAGCTLTRAEGSSQEAVTATPAPEAAARIPDSAPTVALVRWTTATPEPTATPAPTATPEPTATPAPTATPEPTVASAPQQTSSALDIEAILARSAAETATAEAAAAEAAAAETAAAAPAAPPAAPEVVVNPNVEPGTPVRLVIEAIGMDLALVSVGLDANRVPIVPNHDAAWYNQSAAPGAGDNVVLWGHVLRFRNAPNIPAPFARVKELSPGTPITLYNAAGQQFNYIVSDQVWAQPEEISYILPQGSERLTLVSCIGDEIIVDGSLELTHRLITIATPAQ